jgi:predicted transcriptional regulator
MDKKITSWIYEYKIRTIINREKEISYTNLLHMCDISRSKFNTHLMEMLSDELVEKVKKSDLRHTYYKITEKGLKCIEEDVNIMKSFNNIEKLRSSK